MAAVALAISRRRRAQLAATTTLLISVDETIEALRQAQEVQYRAPGS